MPDSRIALQEQSDTLEERAIVHLQQREPI